MEEPELFIEKITINEVRHLKGVEIPISNTERKHLILTGKNGSGKTSVLLELKKNLIGQKSQYDRLTPKLETFIRQIEGDDSHKELKNKFKDLKEVLKKDNLTLNSRIELEFNNNLLESNYIKKREGEFIKVFFEAKRSLNLKIPKGIEKLKLKKHYEIDEYISPVFLQHIVNLKADRSFARDEAENDIVEKIDKWFKIFENSLKEIFEDEKLELKFRHREYSFDIILSNEQTMPFNALSDGYSSILNIIMELMLRMEGKVKNVYDIQGIVLIDEIETHLHIDLQNKILPFLTSFFPKIQFIVSTHSPFVLNSISNAVIYDLEKNLRIEDMSDYPADGIVKGYFDSDEYSQAGIDKIREYEKLALNGQLNEQQQERFDELNMEFRDISGKLAPQLKSEFYRIELERKTRVHAKANG